jgi:cellulose synthase/poly-beta-1,6-N-acetylglucosamine synthase-like glycosyltransferase
VSIAVFGLCLAIVAYAFVGYPLFVRVRAPLVGRPVRRGNLAAPSFTVLLAVRNEEDAIERRVAELRRHIDATGLDGDLIVLADGCTDRTVERGQRFVDDRTRILSWPESRGKAAALTRGAAEARGDILVFADARQTWADDAIARLLENFADPDVGAVSGDLVLESAPGVLAGVGLYWRFEKWLRRSESRCWAQVGVTGAIAAGRRELFEPIPDGTVLDDVCWPLRIAMKGHRVVHDESARAFDRLPEKPVAEFRRKVRTLAGNLQLAATIPASLVPWRNRVWLAWISHKLVRLVVPWALIGLLATSLVIDSPWARGFAAIQIACYAIALLGLVPRLGRNRLFGAAASFLVLNAAAWCACWVWATGRTAASWRKVDYRKPLFCPTSEVPSQS